jgi:hypothetical protein
MGSLLLHLLTINTRKFLLTRCVRARVNSEVLQNVAPLTVPTFNNTSQYKVKRQIVFQIRPLSLCPISLFLFIFLDFSHFRIFTSFLISLILCSKLLK